ncbi:hypothetical protein M0R04_02550 [Candidatus Dojkabacteria bacterium]|jgi:hypothetical protein|nr:hypothetical protein [Candidatus Dojkabacteria bacterium]
MAKPTEHAPLICTILTILAIVGAFISLATKSPIAVILFLLPTVGYEIYRTEGASTKISSIAIGVILVLEIVLIVFHIDFDLAKYLGQESSYIAGYDVPLGSLKIIGPAVIAVLSVILFLRTYGVFTKWLSVIIFIAAFVIVYSLDPVAFQGFLKLGIQKVVDSLRYI